MELDSLYEERKTPAGFLVKVRLAKMTYVVFTTKGPEIPKGAKNQSIVVPVPRVAFLGEEFDLSHFRLGELSFVNVRQGKLVIPYQHTSSGNEVRTIFLNSGSECDILPVIIFHYKEVEEFLRAKEEGVELHHLVLDEEFPRQDLVTLKIRFPSLNMLIIKRKVAQKLEAPGGVMPGKEELERSLREESSIVDFNKVRATDLLEKGNLNMHSMNPVFLARVHLRKVELEKVKQLLLDFSLRPEEVVFIRTFLEVMIRNDEKKEELVSWKVKLQNLDEGFRLAGLILEMKEMEFEVELDKGFSKEIASMVYALLEKEQSEADTKEKEIILWEWKLRTKRLFRKMA
ncbi:hypothetical protein LEP1GSC050_0364 [Leptospira broomii serovar Hurstbridge str. 5399]|uniref:Uncharacterized protein n=1 Tax=Leptospira broomii serovar Hurstbridge str. 5399 TaxID=1049789 RepID=T0GMJ7_9LEPT|nr:hypothetical protein [Leptospira broomii]EQA46568.1 hypothetical protein LEP1GSC050_0364 [Leptospira broomii serovar Hurstbridge str. 5399]